MPKVSDVQEDKLRRLIRDAMAIDPLITQRNLQLVVESKTNRALGLPYLRRLIRKVNGEIVVRADREQVEKRIGQLRENNRLVREGLLKIAYPPAGSMPVADKDRLKALELISRIEQNQAKIEMDFGLFTRHLGALDVDHRHKLIEPENLDKIMDAFKAWGNPPQMRRIEASRIVTVKATPTTNGEPNKQPEPAKPKPNAIPVTTNAGLVPTE